MADSPVPRRAHLGEFVKFSLGGLWHPQAGNETHHDFSARIEATFPFHDSLANTLIGNAGNDLLSGGSGDDTYSFDPELALGSDTIVESGGGIDRLDFNLPTTRTVTVDLSFASAQIVNAGLTLTLSATTAIENATCGSLSDVLTGNSLANTLFGNDGDDVLTGRAGNNVLNGGTSENILIGGDGSDQMTGGTSEDLLLGAR